MFRLLSFVICIALLGCNKKEVISRMDIKTQTDIDYICDNLPDSDTFVGAIVASTDVVLDFKCLKNLRHIKGTVIIEGPGTVGAFRNIESVTGGETFAFCDESVDTMCFPNLKTVDFINISTGCTFSNVIYLPNIEQLYGLSIASSQFSGEGEREGTLVGFDKLEEINDIKLDIDFSNEYFKIDGFSNLKKVNGTFNISAIGNTFDISDKTFSSLTDISIASITKNYNADPSVKLIDILPSLQRCSDLYIFNFDTSDVCYLNEYLETNEIIIALTDPIGIKFYDNASFDELCN